MPSIRHWKISSTSSSTKDNFLDGSKDEFLD
jgi:hypothetical protein